MTKHSLTRLINVFLTVTIVQSAGFTQTKAIPDLMLYDRLFSGSSWFSLPSDDYGTNGAVSLLNLPSGAIFFRMNGLKIEDPLFGQLPTSWFNIRHSISKFDKSGRTTTFSPVYSDSGKLASGFDYFKGDYGFLDFALHLNGGIGNNVRWRFVGSNAAYDGASFLLGSIPSNYGESVSQSFLFDVHSRRNDWQFDYGASYQKYIPGKTAPSVVGSVSGISYLNWGYGGKLKESRAGMSFIASSGTASDSFAIGAQVSSFLYGNHASEDRWWFDATGYQYSGLIVKTLTSGKNRLVFSFEPDVQNVYSESFTSQKLTTLTGNIQLERPLGRTFISMTPGFVNHEVTWNLSARRNLYNRLGLHAEILRDYVFYPNIFFTNPNNTRLNKPPKEGFGFWLASISADYRSKFIGLVSEFGFVNSDFNIPYQNSNSDTMIQFIVKSLNTAYFTEDLSLSLPWKMTLRSKTTFLPSPDVDDFLQMQTWGQMAQAIPLFHGNLKLYLAGEFTYQYGGNSLVWFDELRSVGISGTRYYTNERLNFNIPIGGNIDDFHIFYVIYNAEGRFFSTLGKMPYRNNLKIFGVEWNFLE